MGRPTKTCAHLTRDGKNCPNLQPCPAHPRNNNWSPNRDRNAQKRFREAVLARDSYRCTRCGNTQALVAHHVRPGYEPSAGQTLCGPCHAHLDASAHA